MVEGEGYQKQPERYHGNVENDESSRDNELREGDASM